MLNSWLVGAVVVVVVGRLVLVVECCATTSHCCFCKRVVREVEIERRERDRKK